jgi:uncharacterized membrane protein
LTILVAALVAIGFFVAVAVPYLTLDGQVLARYSSRRVWLLVHVAAGAVALLTGPVQLWLGASGRTARAHRRLGAAYATSVGIGAAASFYLAAHTSLGWAFAAGITGLGLAWVATTTLAIAAVRRGLIEQHREWMIRSYVVTFAFVTFRALWTALQAAGIGTVQEQLAASSWFCWAVPLLGTEIVLQGRRIFGPRALRAGATGLAIVIATALPVGAQARLTGADLAGTVRDESARRGSFPTDPQRDGQGRVTYGLFEQAQGPRPVQLALRVGS